MKIVAHSENLKSQNIIFCFIFSHCGLKRSENCLKYTLKSVDFFKNHRKKMKCHKGAYETQSLGSFLSAILLKFASKNTVCRDLKKNLDFRQDGSGRF
jgi:hypothetical protein